MTMFFQQPQDSGRRHKRLFFSSTPRSFKWVAVCSVIAFHCAHVAGQPQPVKPQRSSSSQRGDQPAGASLDRLIANLPEWRAVDWTKPNVLDDLSWTQLSKPETSPNGRVLKQEAVGPAFGVAEMKRLRWRSIDSDRDVMLAMHGDVPASDCPNLAAAVGKELGQPIVSNDTSRIYFSETSFVEMVSRDWQWTAGNTRVSASCFGTTSSVEEKPQKVSLSVVFEPTIQRAELKPAFLLRCSRTVDLSIGGGPRPLSDLVFWVSPNVPFSIRNTRLVWMSENDSIQIDEYRIAFTLKNQETSTRYVIDRVSGQLVGEATAQGKAIGKISGACSKAESTTKF
jgi:hypothetical protein